MLNVLSVFGTRPEAVKMAPLIKTMEHDGDIKSYVCVTAQHRGMLDQVDKFFKIKPDYDLNIMSGHQTLSDITSKVLRGMDRVLEELKPDLMLVHGDTTTTFAGALSAFYHKIDVGHVEAGLRTNDKYFPYPEEINRRLTSQLSDIHFAPTKNSFNNLLGEGVRRENIFITGNTVIDALKYTVIDGYIFENEKLNADFGEYRIITMTAHRRENLGKPLENICAGVKKILENFKDVYIIYPVHLNPAVRHTVFKLLGGLDRVLLIDPISISDMHNLISKSYFVMTDSGGLQEEVPSLGKPVLVLRDVTERPEAVEAGTAVLVGTDAENILSKASLLLSDEAYYEKMAKAVNPYGDGKASERIVKAIKYKYGIINEKPEEFIAR